MGRAPWARGAGGEEHPHFPEPSPRCKRGNNRSGPTTLAWACHPSPVSSWASAWHPFPRTLLTPRLKPSPARTGVCHQLIRRVLPSRCARRPFQDVTPWGAASTARTRSPTVLQAGSPGSRCWQGGSWGGHCPRLGDGHLLTMSPHSLSCATWCLFPFYRDTSPVRQGPHP